MATSKKSATAAAVPPVTPTVAKPKATAKTAPKAPSKTVAKPVAKAPAKPPAKVAVKAPAKAAAPKKAKPAVKSAGIDPTQRAHYIEVAAFYIAERRGFTPGNPEQDYLDAAAEIDRLIAAGHFGK